MTEDRLPPSTAAARGADLPTAESAPEPPGLTAHARANRTAWNGLAIDDLVEIRPPADASSTYTMDAGFEWARRWPCEHVWKLRKEG